MLLLALNVYQKLRCVLGGVDGEGRTLSGLTNMHQAHFLMPMSTETKYVLKVII